MEDQKTSFGQKMRGTKEKDIVSLYQLDPTFYDKIVSRKSTTRKSFYDGQNPTMFPFQWEMQPGEPKDDESKTEIKQPIKLPPALYSLNLPKPCKPPCGLKSHLTNSINKVKKIKNAKINTKIIRLPSKVHCFTKRRLPRIHVPSMGVKSYLLQGIKKLKETKSNILQGKNVKAKSPESRHQYHNDGCDFSSSDGRALVSSPGFGSDRSDRSSSPPCEPKSKKSTRLWSAPGVVLKWRLFKPT